MLLEANMCGEPSGKTRWPGSTKVHGHVKQPTASIHSRVLKPGVYG